MGQCGCGEFGVKEAFKLPDGQVFAYGVYRGCSECFPGPGISIYAYPNAKTEWLWNVKPQPYKPDEYGGNDGLGVSVSFFEVRDLVEAAKEIGSTALDGGYESVEDWLEDNGLQMMQEAMRKFDKRMKELEKQRRKRK